MSTRETLGHTPSEYKTSTEQHVASPEIFEMYWKLNTKFPQMFAAFVIPQHILAHLLDREIDLKEFRKTKLSPEQIDQLKQKMSAVHENYNVPQTPHMNERRLQGLFDAFAHGEIEGILYRIGPDEEFEKRKKDLQVALMAGNQLFSTDEFVKTALIRYRQLLSEGKRRNDPEIKQLLSEFSIYIKPALESLFEKILPNNGSRYVRDIYGKALQDLYLEHLP